MENKKIKNQFEIALENLIMDVGAQILELRLIKGYTQDVLAKMVGTQQPSIARIERGATVPTLDLLNKLAVASGTHLIPPKFAVVEEYAKKFEDDHNLEPKISGGNSNESGYPISSGPLMAVIGSGGALSDTEQEYKL